MKQRLLHAPPNDVLVLTFDRNERAGIEWEEEQEFRYKGEMYDVIEQRYEGDQLIIRCLPDKKEKALLEAYQNMAQKNTSSPGQASLIKLLTTQFLASAHLLLIQLQKEVGVEFFRYSAPLPTMVARVVKHPPRCCCIIDLS